jgi:uncharacterized membrane protein
LVKKKKRNSASQKKTVSQKKPGAQKKQPNWLLAGLAAVGMVITAYLVITGWLDKAPLLCHDGSSCDIVQQSRWGTFLMLPTALWGFLAYSMLFNAGIRVRNIGTNWKFAWTVSMIGLGYSIYLITISIFVIEAMCAYCITSFILMLVIFGVVTFQRPKALHKFNFMKFARQTIIIAVVFVGGMHLHYSGVFDPKAGPEDPYLKGLAVHLTESKAILYGAYW